MTHSLLLHTSRLTIVGISDINTRDLIDYFTLNREHLRFAGGRVPETPEEVRAVRDNWLTQVQEGREVRFFLLQEEQLIGVAGISNIVRGAFQAAYLGYNLAEHCQGQGLMTEALEEIVAFAFSALNLHRLMANYRPDNVASERVLQKLGFVREGMARDYLRVDGEWADHVLTALTNPSWREN
ncbi:GNAT family N-acetyltransferase [Reinekea blandensis]|uniref:Ribosomal-protein-alanine N-acetyltransferase n=1 Tax=Reinekea blandensis MED297 TaxID=314283 RepID=A4BJ18_9GAMM|nr:GNAT family N-acetyltransferase [Reinekea blandensis]EAR07863.1 ribosomal-protein-alanine N-acetyltransferase [Reinekea sp. MED297] [Reinekea blandensis MED297]